jgi:hypothetical protein
MSLPLWVYRIPWGIVQEIAQELGLNHLYIAAIIMVESNGYECATRYEPNWSYHWQVGVFAELAGTTTETEYYGQMTSWGPMQIMGTTSRERGFRGLFPELCKPKVGIKFGCLHFKKLFDKYGNYEDAIAAYNAGNVRKTPGGLYENEKYVDKVMGFYREFQEFIEK